MIEEGDDPEEGLGEDESPLMRPVSKVRQNGEISFKIVIQARADVHRSRKQ